MLTLPKPNITRDQMHRFLTNPQVVTLEFLFIFLTLANVLVIYRLLQNVIPFPITVTWIQFIFAFFFSYIFGEAGKEFPKAAYFPRFSLSTEEALELLLPACIYLLMMTLANVLLAATPTVATFPVVVALAVFLHHVARFVGCGQVYLPARWLSVGIMLLGFFVAACDPKTMGPRLFPLAVGYGVSSACYRAWCLEKAMHVVQGKGNDLHNHQVTIGLVLLPALMLLTGELKFFSYMPYTFGILYTWQVWGCLATVGALPFLKNIVANRLIRQTGQAPWRALELLSVVVIFIVGYGIWDKVSIFGVLACVLVVLGRGVGMLDVLSKDVQPAAIHANRRREEMLHSASPQYDDKDSQSGSASVSESVLDTKSEDVALSSQSIDREYQEESEHAATSPFVSGWFDRSNCTAPLAEGLELFEAF